MRDNTLFLIIVIVFILLYIIMKKIFTNYNHYMTSLPRFFGGLENTKNTKNTVIKNFKIDNYDIKYKDITYAIPIIHPLLELKRENILNRIFKQYTEVVLKYIDKSKIESKFHTAERNLETQLSRYIMYLLSENNINDPIIPTIQSSEDDYMNLRNDLHNKLGKYNTSELDNNNILIDKIMKEADLKNKFDEGFKELFKYYKDNLTKLRSERVVIKKTFKRSDQHRSILLNFDSDEIAIHSQLYDKLTDKYNKLGKRSDYESDILIYCLVKRYIVLHSFNQQLAVERTELLKMKANNDINFELFGSVINTALDHYCSLFYDIEKYFGSLGSSFDIEIISGNFTINPPFDETIMEKIIDRLLNKFMTADKSSISAIIWIPVWDADGRQKIQNMLNNTNYTTRDKDYGVYKPIELINVSKFTVSKELIPIKDIKFFNYTTYKYVNATSMYKITVKN